MSLPVEICDAIALYVERLGEPNSPERKVPHSYKIWSSVSRDRLAWSSESRQRLATLRLVSKAFCSSASQRLFRHIIVALRSSHGKPPLHNLLEISNSPYATYVREIEFGFWGAVKESLYPVYPDDLSGTVPIYLAKLPNLSALKFSAPPSYYERQILINTVVMGLCSFPLENLVDLELAFSAATDFGLLFHSSTTSSWCLPINSWRVPMEQVLRGLRHLSLYISDYVVDLPDYEMEDAFNQKGAPHVARLVNLATNSKSLKIDSWDILSLDDIKFDPSVQLEFLELVTVSISSHILFSLIEQSSESLRYMKVVEVELNSGTWQHILTRLSTMESLLSFGILSCGYSGSGQSSHLTTRFRPNSAVREDIETSYSPDLHALGDLERQVNANRIAAGLSPILEPEFRYLEWQPLVPRIEELSLGEVGSL